jgi:hypothetical protein
MIDRKRKPVDSLLRAYQYRKNASLNFVYVVNLRSKVQNAENTFFPYCKRVLFDRVGFRIVSNHLKEDHCPGCQNQIPGSWIKLFLINSITYKAILT